MLYRITESSSLQSVTYKNVDDEKSSEWKYSNDEIKCIHVYVHHRASKQDEIMNKTKHI